MKKLIILFVTTALLLTTCVLYSSTPDLSVNKSETSLKVMSILSSLEKMIKHEDASIKMQEIFPEGACFTLTLYGMTWYNIAKYFQSDVSIRQKALDEMRWTIDQYDEKFVLEYFEDTEVKNGVFWFGQKNLMLGRYIEIRGVGNVELHMIQEFNSNSFDLYNAFMKSPTHHLNTYKELCWPADNVTALLSLSVHDRLFDTNYINAYAEWKNWTLENSDPLTGMPAGHIDNSTGQLHQPARGCANSWIITLIHDIDPGYSNDLYRKYVEYFLISRLGIRMLREYPKGINYPADVDSGPIIWDAGTAASGLGIGAAILHKDLRTAVDLSTLINIFSFPSSKSGERRYFFGKLPIADAFLAWQYSIDF